VQTRSSHRASESYLLATRRTLQPDPSKWPVFLEEYFGGRPYHQSCSLFESGLRHSLHPFLLRDIRRNTHKHRHSHVYSRPLTQGDEVSIRAIFDGQVAHIHGTWVPLQPEAHRAAASHEIPPAQRACCLPHKVATLAHYHLPYHYNWMRLLSLRGVTPQNSSCHWYPPQASYAIVDVSQVIITGGSLY
jgi:hypothetical protein